MPDGRPLAPTPFLVGNPVFRRGTEEVPPGQPEVATKLLRYVSVPRETVKRRYIVVTTAKAAARLSVAKATFVSTSVY